jgi:hypothetical protein
MYMGVLFKVQPYHTPTGYRQQYCCGDVVIADDGEGYLMCGWWLPRRDAIEKGNKTYQTNLASNTDTRISAIDMVLCFWGDICHIVSAQCYRPPSIILGIDIIGNHAVIGNN